MLDSWNAGVAKTALLDFVAAVTTPGDSFVPPEERIATFDLDGTLWCEKPRYVQAEFLMRRIDTPVVAAEGRSKLARARDFLGSVPELVAGISDITRGITTDEFEVMIGEFLDTATHPVLGMRYPELAYRPMVELIRLLQDNRFHVYICTGGGRDFTRVISEKAFGIPRGHVIGSAGAVEYRDGDIYRKKGVELPIDDGAGKPVHIWKRTGRKPLFACGNSDGDFEMLEIARFGVLVHHDDAEREFAYDDKAERVLAGAADHGWTIVSMRDDFRTVF